jgi:hypothetical protein
MGRISDLYKPTPKVAVNPGRKDSNPLSERNVTIAAELYQTRRVMRSLFGAEYKRVISPWVDLIRDGAKAAKVSPFRFVTDMATKMNQEGRDITMLLAALVELLEPSEESRG